MLYFMGVLYKNNHGETLVPAVTRKNGELKMTFAIARDRIKEWGKKDVVALINNQRPVITKIERQGTNKTLEWVQENVVIVILSTTILLLSVLLATTLLILFK